MIDLQEIRKFAGDCNNVEALRALVRGLCTHISKLNDTLAKCEDMLGEPYWPGDW